MTGEAQAQAQEAVAKLAAATARLAVEEEEAATERAAQAAREAAAATPPEPGFGAQFVALLGAASGVVSALRKFVAAFGALLGAEARVLRAGVPLFFIGIIALVAFSVSLWACLVALFGWLLLHATHSMGIALLLLVLGHALLVVGIWSAIKRGVHQASFPQARAEWRAMRHQLADDLRRFNASRPHPEPSAPGPAATESKP